ncbi:hypothetical protein BDF21DRAFT_343452, partial [Thamnidium elegans]
DLRIISRYAKTPYLPLSEFAKRPAPSKYYYKKKAVIVSLIHLKETINNGNLSIEEAKQLRIPFILCERLESDIYTIRVISEEWTVVGKLKDVDVPCSIKEVKEGRVEELLKTLKYFKVYILARCILCLCID